MSDAIKNEAHRIAMELTGINALVTEMTTAAKAAAQGKQVVVGIPIEMLKQLGTVAEDATRLFAAMGVVDRGRIAEEMKAKEAGVEKLLSTLSPVIEGIREIMQRRADASNEECDCPACTLERSLGGNSAASTEDKPEGRTLH